MNWLVSVMYQFPVSYADEVEYVIVYEPSKPVLTAVSYVFPDGLDMMAWTAVYGLPIPDIWI